jgi:hypothetical protein
MGVVRHAVTKVKQYSQHLTVVYLRACVNHEVLTTAEKSTLRELKVRTEL